jgi:hypothetical protein
MSLLMSDTQLNTAEKANTLFWLRARSRVAKRREIARAGS